MKCAYRYDPHVKKKIAFRIKSKEGHLLRNPGTYYTIGAQSKVILSYIFFLSK